jgi:quercetin dioxygenase-like cupin family protein
VNLAEWFATHRPADNQKMRFDVMFQTPRVMVATITNQGQLFGLHYHAIADELVFLIKGNCKEYVDGKWIAMHAGDVHFNPRGVIHGTQCDGEAQELHFFTPVTGDNDRVFLDSGKTSAKSGDVVADWSLIDTQFKKGMIITLDEWSASHPIPAGESMRVDLPVGTPRFQMTIGQKPKLDAHFHGSSDEIIYVYKGVGEMLVKGEWVKVKAGEIHFNPRGFIHGIRPVSDDFKISAVFTPPQANGNDRIFVK